MVIAQFTGVALQNDYQCWQQYNAGTWGGVGNFTQYRNADPDNIRMNPARQSFHVRAVNRAVIKKSRLCDRPRHPPLDRVRR